MTTDVVACSILISVFVFFMIGLFTETILVKPPNRRFYYHGVRQQHQEDDGCRHRIISGLWSFNREPNFLRPAFSSSPDPQP
jgi:hypothetical protein